MAKFLIYRVDEYPNDTPLLVHESDDENESLALLMLYRAKYQEYEFTMERIYD